MATNIRKHYPAWLLYVVVLLLLVANTINIAADVSAMGDAGTLLVGGPAKIFTIVFGVGSLVLQSVRAVPPLRPRPQVADDGVDRPLANAG